MGLPAQESEEAEPPSEVGAQDDEQADSGFVPIPVVGYSPDTGVLLGGSGFYFWQPQANVTSTDNNTLAAFLVYGTRGIFSASQQATFNLADGAYKPELGFYIGRAPSDFFGIGPDAETDDQEVYTTFSMDAEGAFLIRLLPGLYAGPVVSWIYQDMLETEDGGILETQQITGSDEIRSGGAGGRIVRDTRSPQLYPSSGYYLSFDTVAYPRALASHDGYTRFALDYRQFVSPWEGHIFAWQGIAETVVGDAPFHYLPYLGGQSELRGYTEARYRDDVAVEAQLEYRFPIWWRFGGVLFGGAGQVAPSFGELELAPADVAAAAGVGLRFTIEQSQNLNLRFDFAVTRDGSTGFYVQFREAF